MVTSSLRLRRLVDRQVEIKQQLITFHLREIPFLLPIQSVYRALTFTQWDSFTTLDYEGMSLPIIDVDRQIFGHKSSHPPAAPIALIVQNQNQQRCCLPIDSAPSLCRVPASNFVALPKTYQVRCVSDITSSTSDQPLMFRLNPEELLSL
jgi:chemotaxis signal transduction protein